MRTTARVKERIMTTTVFESAALESILYFSLFSFFGAKLGHFTINGFFLYVTNAKAYQRKTEKIFVSEEKKF